MNTLITDRVQRSFSRSFGSYHAAAGLQAQIAADLADALHAHDAPAQFDHGLELGCGTGHLTHELQARFRFQALTLNDLAPEAAATATAAKARFVCGDAERIAWPQRPDLICSASMIQWLHDPAALMRRMSRALAPGGWLAVSGFGPRQFHELTQIGSSAEAPGLSRPEDLSAAICDELEVMVADEDIRTIRFASPHDLLRHLRSTGVNGRARAVWTRSDLRRFSDAYVARHGCGGTVPLTYHPIWIIARKPD
ncbi:methyltransferase domain-containing protein [Ruegeria lacuscaerulensis]|uniref:methyltransferase domain-containing protein n=1 Tax=Ruegeria lacuscaerulensis TaxID=55218 RepID=UPI001479B78E|nr:methyltransferase domain-containing protein [Ruegeria lacuscaerulensis]